MVRSNMNKMEPFCSNDIESQGGEVGINEMHEKCDKINEEINEMGGNWSNLSDEINEEINEVGGNWSNLSDEICICKVPETLRCINPKAFTPKVLSIGPIHHGNKEFKMMEDIKKIFLKSFLERRIGNKFLEDYLEIIIEREQNLRDAYLEPIEFKSHEFVKIIMLDAAFIIEFMMRVLFPDDLTHPLVDFDFNIYAYTMLAKASYDLLLLENQIPFFILQDLFDPINGNATGIVLKTGDQLTIVKLFYKFSKEITHFQFKDPKITDQVKHYLDFLRILYKTLLPLEKESTDDSVENPNKYPLEISLDKESMDDWGQTPSITKLHQAGVKFKAVSSDNLFAIKFDFNSGVLELPKLITDSMFETRIRNLIACEQYGHYDESNICDYARLMDDLINTPEDVDLLAKYEIINILGDNNKVCDLFNNISKGIYWDPKKFYFAKTKKDMIKYCKNPINQWKANLKQNYFNTPWRTVSVVAAILLLILTIIQTVTSVMSLI